MNQRALFEMPQERGAIFSTDGRYRWRLWRRAHREGKRLVWIMLNPSTAGADADDPTVRKCDGFAGRWGCGRYDIVNVFGLVSSDPRALRHHPDPIGMENDSQIVAAISKADMIVAAWGQGLPAKYIWRRDNLQRLVRGREVYCLSRTKDGHPRHPLLLAYSTPLELFWDAG